MDLKGVSQSIVNFVMEIPYHVTSMIDEIRFSVLDPESKQAINLQAIQILNGMRTNKETKKEIEKAVKHAIVDVAQFTKIQEVRNNNLNKTDNLNEVISLVLSQSDDFSKVLTAKIPPRIQAAITDFNELNTPIVLNESPDFQTKIDRFREFIEDERNIEDKDIREYLKDPSILKIAQDFSAQLQGSKTRQELLDLFANLRNDVLHELQKTKGDDIGADDLMPALLACVLAINNSKIKHAIESLDIFFQTYDNHLVEMCNSYVAGHARVTSCLDMIDLGPHIS